MLPTFPKAQKILDEAWKKRMFAAKNEVFPLHIHPPVEPIIEGKDGDFQREDGQVKPLKIERHQVTTQYQFKDGKGMSLEDFYGKAKEVGEGLGKQMWQMVTGVIDGDFDLKDFEKDLGQITALVETIAARRMWRNVLATFWAPITKIDLIRVVPDEPADSLLWNWGHDRGLNQSRKFSAPHSWSALLAESRRDESDSLPSVIREEFDFALVFVLCFPHRLTRALVKYFESTMNYF